MSTFIASVGGWAPLLSCVCFALAGGICMWTVLDWAAPAPTPKEPTP